MNWSRTTSDPTQGPGSRRARGNAGVALVEFAIVMPLVFAILLGIFTGGIALSRKNSMTNAVREGTRLGATLSQNAATWATDVRDRVRELSAGDVDNNQICVKLVQRTTSGETLVTDHSWLPSACNSPSPPRTIEPSSAGVRPGDCVVKVWATRKSEFNTVFFTRNLDLDAKAIGRFERGGAPSPCTP